MSRYIESIAGKVDEEIKNEVAQCYDNGITLTTDIWTDNHRRVSYMSLTLHYILEQGKNLVYKNRITRLMPLEVTESKTYKEIKTYIETMLERLNLSDHKDKLTFVTDRGGNIVKALDVLKINRVNCQAHIVDNIVKQINKVKPVDDIFKILLPIVKYVKITGLNEVFPDGCKIKSFAVTRWNAAYRVLKSVYENWSQLQSELDKRKTKHSLEGLDKNDIKNLVDFLEPFKNYTDELESEQIGVFNVLPIMNKIEDWIALNDNDSEIKKAVKRECIDYYNGLNHIRKFHYMGLALYPPTNTMRILDDSEKAKTKQLIKRNVCQLKEAAPVPEIVITDPETTKPPSKKRRLSVLSDALNVDADNKCEVDRYFNHKETKEIDALEWWSANRNKYPHLYKIALKILAIQSSSATSERGFSSAGNIVGDNRVRLDSHKLEDQLILSKNIDLFEKFN